RLHELGMRHILQRAAILLAPGRQPRQDQYRGLGDVSVGDARHRVRDARTGGHERDAELAGQLGMRMRHVDGRALVAHVDDPDTFSVDAHPDRHDVATAQSENSIDTPRTKDPRNDARAGVRSDRWWNE